MSLNHKRRIFRQGAGSVPSRGHRRPAFGVVLAAAGGVATMLVMASLFVRSTDAPARAPADVRVAAGADRLAVIDGDTLLVGDQVVRLAGIVAPARGSVCHGAGAIEMDCGAAAANALAALVRGRAVECAVSGHDAQGRPAGICVAGDKTLNAVLVVDGWARAASENLHEKEMTARAAGRGIWRTGS